MPYQNWMTPVDQESQLIPWLMKKLAGGGDPNFYKQQPASQNAPVTPVLSAALGAPRTPAQDVVNDMDTAYNPTTPALTQAMSYDAPDTALALEQAQIDPTKIPAGPDPYAARFSAMAQATKGQPGILDQIMANPQAAQMIGQMGAGMLRGKDLREGLANAFDASNAASQRAQAVKRTPLTGNAAGLIMEEYPDGRMNIVPAGDVANKGRSKPPPGFQWKADGSGLEPIPGGPKDPNNAESARMAGITLAKLGSRTQIVNESIKKALEQTDWTSAGFLGQLTKSIGGTPGANLASTIKTVESIIAFKELEDMRAASKTGGALGQVAVQELEMLKASLGDLAQSQGPEQLRGNLNKVLQRFNSSTAAIAKLYKDEGRELPPALQNIVGDGSSSPASGSDADRANAILRGIK